MQRWLYGGDDWGIGYYHPSHRVTTPDCAVCVAAVKEHLHDKYGAIYPGVIEAIDRARTMLFPADATYLFEGHVIDWSKPFPSIADRGPIVEWVESWLDRIQFTESAGHYPWESVDANIASDLLNRLHHAAAAVDPDAIDRVAERAAAKAVEAIETRDARGVGSEKVDWEDVQGRLLAKRERGESFTTNDKLAKDCGCSEGTIRKAIRKSDILKGWKARSKGPTAAPNATDLDAVVKANTRQTKEPAPDDVLLDEDMDATFAKLIDQAKPAHREQLNAMPHSQRRELVKAYLSQNLDDEPSPLDNRKPGERSRKVKQYKRA
jgi:hypothetical protein